MMNQAYFTKSFFVSANEANAQQLLSPTVLTTNIIDIATAHANSLRVGNPDMADIGGGWVLSRLTIEMTRWPAADSEYSLTTWIESINRHFSERCFRIDDAEGNILGYARTVWMIIDRKHHVNLGLSHFDLSSLPVTGEGVPITRQGRHRPIVNDTDAVKNSIRALCNPVKYTFKYCDIDFYRHVNTVRYLVLLLNQFTLEQMDSHRLYRLEFSFMHEARYGMTVDIMRGESETPDTYIFTLCEENRHTAPLLFAKISLRKA